ncbi:unnamed protein product [Brassica napus]|uniref:(rape) hypothetical protein n=1 Tax=Brassica napus TaxID=3708 RepID=A0A816IY39_BRANA|nr:unnamed protein product [Brassica napus]
MDCWEVTAKKKKVVKEDSPRPRKKAQKRHLLKLVKRQLQRLVKRT